jgi:hypothetical protein
MGRIYFEGAFDNFDKGYGDECVKQLKEDKKFPLVVTPKQAVIIVQPIEAMEDFYCDGEIGHAEALEDWKERLKLVGFNPTHVGWIEKYVFG